MDSASIRHRGPGRSRFERIDEALSKLLLTVLTTGLPARDQQRGGPLRDDAGQIVYLPPSAAYVEAACSYLKLHGYEPTKRGNVAAGGVAAALERLREEAA